MSRSTVYSFIAGPAAVGTVTVVAVMGGVVAGRWPRPHILVLAAGVLAAAVAAFLAHRHLSPVSFRLGAILAGAAALVSELIASRPGLGALQVVTAVAAAGMSVGGPRLLSPLTRRLPAGVVWVGVAALVLVFVRIVVAGGELGHDEAAYAVKAQAWVAGTPDTGWGLHRGIGQSVLAAVVLPFSRSAAALRSLSVVLSVGTVVAVWGLGRTMRSNRAGLTAAGIFAVAPSFLRRGAEFLSDVPSTGLLVVVAILLWRWIESSPVRHSNLYGAVAVAAAAFYIRYQSILSLGLLAVATTLVAWPRLRDSLPVVGRAAGLGAVLLVPHFLFATAATGTPWGVIAATAEAGGQAFLGEGLVDYLGALPDLLAGQLGAVAIVVAVVWAAWMLARGDDRRPAVFLMVPALGQITVLGLLSHGEPRFVFFPVALAAVAAGLAAEQVRRRLPRQAYRAGAVALAVAMVVSLGLHGDRADRNAEARAETVAVLAGAAQAVVSEAERPCGIVTGSLPQMTWLSGCHTVAYDLRQPRVRLPDQVDGFLVLSEHGPRQPEGSLREAYLDLTEGDPIVVEGEGGIGDVQVWEVAEE